MTQLSADDAGRFRLDSRIATGGMGEVWRATDTVLDREVAVKLLKAEYADDPTFRSRFETEARHAAALHHPGVAAVYDVGESAPTDGSEHPRPFLVMELVEGQPLSVLLDGARKADQVLDPEVVRDLMAQTGEALGAAHRAGIIHRDVKPANLMVTPDGVVKVTDFGIARAADGVGITRTGAVMGTPQYLSPEQAEGRTATSASDVYSLGVVAFECLAGVRPFEADSPVATALAHIRQPVPDLPATIPDDLAAVVKQALAKDPDERFPDGAAFAAALRDPATAVVPLRPPVVPPPLAPPVVDPTATQVLTTPVAPVADPLPPAPVVTTTTVDDAPRRSGVGPVLVAVALLVALAVVVTLLLTKGGDDTPVQDTTTQATRTGPRTPASSAGSSAPATATIDPSAYIGRPVDDAVADLRALGLQDVSTDEVTNDGSHTEGTVSDVSRSGVVEVDQPVTVSYWGAAPSTPTDVPSSTSSAPSPAPSTTSSAPTTPSPSPTPTATSSAPAVAPSTTSATPSRSAVAATPTPSATTTPRSAASGGQE